MSLLRNPPDCSTKKYFRSNSNILTGEVKQIDTFFIWRTFHLSTMLVRNINLLNKRDNTEVGDPRCFIEWLS